MELSIECFYHSQSSWPMMDNPNIGWGENSRQKHWPLSKQLREDRLRRISGPVHLSVLLHKLFVQMFTFIGDANNLYGLPGILRAKLQIRLSGFSSIIWMVPYLSVKQDPVSPSVHPHLTFEGPFCESVEQFGEILEILQQVDWKLYKQSALNAYSLQKLE